MTSTRSAASWLAGLAVAATAAGSAAQSRPSPPEVEAEAAVERELAGTREFRDITVVVRNRTIELSGTVPHLSAKRRAIELALTVEGFEVASLLTIPAAEDDSRLAETATAAIRRYGFYSVFDDLNVGATRGAVRLTGAVTEPHKKSDVEALVSRIPGVTDIENQVEVLPVNALDDRIRRAIASEIYTHTLFSKYAGQPDPPVHIIVKHGQVRLTGVVHSRVEREFASMLARQVDGVRWFRSELRIEGPPER